MNKRAIAPLALAITIALTGCAATSTTADSSVATLAKTKPPVQLLRNQAIGRIAVQVIDNIDETTDISIACESAAEDPDELMRAWQSTFTASIVSGNAFRVDAIASNLAEAFTDEGWVSTANSDGTIALSNETVPVDILITPELLGESEANLIFEATGACVETAGKDSAEVKDLEAAVAP